MRVSYPSSYPNPRTQSNRLKGKRLDGRGGGIRTPDPLLPKQMRYQTALRPDVALIVSRKALQPEPLVHVPSMAALLVDKPREQP